MSDLMSENEELKQKISYLEEDIEIIRCQREAEMQAVQKVIKNFEQILMSIDSILLKIVL